MMMELERQQLTAFTFAVPFVPCCQQASTKRLSLRRQRCLVPRIRSAKRLSAPHRQPPSCSANRGDWEKFQTRANESLQGAQRFFQTSTGQAVIWGVLLWLLLTGRIGWIFDSFIILLVLFSVVPIIGVLALRWWLNRQLVQGTCPSCGAAVTGLRNQPFQCMRCGQVVEGEKKGNFSVNDPSSATIDIDAKRID